MHTCMTLYKLILGYNAAGSNVLLTHTYTYQTSLLYFRYIWSRLIEAKQVESKSTT